MIFKKKLQMILQFQKEISVVMYIIEKTFKLNFNNFIWTKSQSNMKFQSLCFYNV
jgi:hypothetical protein